MWDGNRTDVAGEETSWVGLALPLTAAFVFAVGLILATVGLREGTSVIVGLTIKTGRWPRSSSAISLGRGRFRSRVRFRIRSSGGKCSPA